LPGVRNVTPGRTLNGSILPTMDLLPRRFRQPRWVEPATSLRLAAILTWMAVACVPVLNLISGKLLLEQTTILGFSGVVATPILYALANVRFGHASVGLRRWWVVLEIPAILLAYWGLDDISQPALLVIVASQLVVAFDRRTAILILSIANVALIGLLQSRLTLVDVITNTIGYGCFQAFTVLVIIFAQRATSARDALSRINSELMATRELLLESTRSEERLRLSRELHDVVGHKLTALKLQLRLHVQVVTENSDTIAMCSRLADELLTDVRGVVSALRYSDGIDLHQSLKALIPALSNPQIELNLSPEARVPRLEQAHALLRCTQEGLTNALRHSGAKRIVISLSQSPDGVTLIIEDDGPTRSMPAFGNGLTGMHERLELLGGKLEIVPRPQQGLRLSAWLPQSTATVPCH
jgi:signal transduction histidine kinase